MNGEKRGKLMTKRTVWLSEEMVAELERQAKRTGRPVGWLLRFTWLSSRQRVLGLPDMPAWDEEAA